MTLRQLSDSILPALKNRWVKVGLKSVLGLLVIVAVGRHVRSTLVRIQEQGGVLQVEPGWVILGLLLYLLGLILYGIYFALVLRASATPGRSAAAVRAYLISHLGKYVPGKALVVLIRVALTRPHGVRPATSAFASLYETFVMMTSGSLVALVGFLARPTVSWLILISLGLSVAFLLVVLPRCFPYISALLSIPFKGVGSEALPRFTSGLLVKGLVISGVGWVLLGLSQVAVIRAVTNSGVDPGDWPLVIASVALATVAGFAVAILPGGLGVREGILIATLAPCVGADTAVLGALALRLVWLLGELLAAGALMLLRPRVSADPLIEVPVT